VNKRQRKKAFKKALAAIDAALIKYGFKMPPATIYFEGCD